MNFNHSQFKNINVPQCSRKKLPFLYNMPVDLGSWNTLATCEAVSRPVYLIIGNTNEPELFTFVRNSLCSALMGMAKPLIIEPKISSNSATPLNDSSS